ncbi:MAG: hypothetical protein LQ345_003241 [Seirophora villosa]|nr:MAG: hypothetical protein LQ345_003241 [Seirophora villosa]
MAPKRHSSRSQTFSSRAESETLPALSSYLLSLVSIKQSNLCVSADVHTTSALLRLADEVGDSICVLKTHVDIIDDFSDRTIKGLQEIAKRKYFLIFEDRKFGDIGNTVQSQYTRGPLRIATWAHLTNAHLFPGPALIPALHSAATSTLISLNQSVSTEISTGTPRSSIDGNPFDDAELSPLSPSTTRTPHPPLLPKPSSPTATTSTTQPLIPADFDMSHRRGSTVTATTTISQTYEPSPPNPASLSRTLSSSSDPALDRAAALAELGPPPHARGLLLLAQMSSDGNMLDSAYTNACVAAARGNRDFVLGFVAQEDLNRDKGDEWVVFTPGVGLPADNREARDGLGQRWRGPREVVRDEGADVVIVGRGILGAKDRRAEAERYRLEAWRGYEERVERRRCQ